ncbi:MAG: RNA helicase [Acidobacteriota bacterium]|nr:RNA helicase [Acidobacteriota bacterium]
MPISAIDDCTADHWAEVKAVVIEAVESIAEPRFTVRLVSDADETGVIQKRIVQNVYNSDIIVCDVSAKNPNVMFELGLRLAFDKPTVIIKDDKTDYSFDTGIIEHVTYPRDLRFAKIVDFKNTLADKVAATHKAGLSDPNHSPFLKNFGTFQVAALSQTEVAPDKIVVELLTEMQSDLDLLKRRVDDGTIRRRGLLDEGVVTGVSKIVSAVAKYKRKHKVADLIDLVGNSDLYDFVEVDINAPRYFASPTAFKEAVNAVLRGAS